MHQTRLCSRNAYERASKSPKRVNGMNNKGSHHEEVKMHECLILTIRYPVERSRNHHTYFIHDGTV